MDAAPPSTLPEAVQDALNRQDRAALDAALAALPAEERAQVEALLEAGHRRAVEEAGRRCPEEILAGLPPELRRALEAGEEAALQAALAALPEEQRQRALADLAVLQAQAVLAAQEAQQRQRIDALIRAIATIAAGEDGPREAVEAELAELEAGGWMLRGPIARLWAGERDRDALVAGLDEHDTRLVERALELARTYERGELRTPARVLADLPEAVRAALESNDQAAFDAAFATLDEAEQARIAALLDELQGAPGEPTAAPAAPAPYGRAALLASLPAMVRVALEQGDAPAVQSALDALPEAERSALVEQLLRAGIIRTEARPRPDMDQVIQQFLPLLGDIALAAHGDETARLLAEAVLPRMEQGGWQLAGAARRIWAGERDATALTEDLDEQDSVLVRQILRLIAGGRELIAVASSLQIARLRRQADEAATQTRSAGPQEREALAAQLEAVAGQADGRLEAPWQDLAAHLRELAGQLRAG